MESGQTTPSLQRGSRPEEGGLSVSNAAQVLESWMHSPGHRTNILNRNFTEMGAGYSIDRAGRPYYVQVFAEPR